MCLVVSLYWSHVSVFLYLIVFWLFVVFWFFFFFFKQKTAYEMRISDWSSDVCSSDLALFGSARNARLRLNSCRTFREADIISDDPQPGSDDGRCDAHLSRYRIRLGRSLCGSGE